MKYDSTCKKHNNPYESYCPICKENKCSYCSIDHDKNHEKEEILLKKKLLKKNELNAFKNTIKQIKNNKNNIEAKINLVISELQEKIELLNKLKNKFFESLDMKLCFVELLLNNYEKKLENFDINYSIINNLENQMKFNLPNLEINKDTSLEKKIKNITKYLNRNISLQFNHENNEKNEIILENDESDEYFKKVTTFNCNSQVVGFLDFNKYLMAIYFSDSIFFISKNNFIIKFKVKEFEINNIKTCKKINDEKILIYTNKDIIFINIIDNKDYIIEKKISISYDIYDFNSHLDLLYFKRENNYYNPEIEIGLFSFPDYTKKKFVITPEKTSNYNEDNKLQFNNENSFFLFSSYYLELYSISFFGCYLENSVKINLNLKNAAIINSNNDFYYLYTRNMILILKRSNLSIVKSISIDSCNLGIIKISDKIISLFLHEKKKFVANIYDILSNGVNLEKNQKKEISNGKVINFFQSNNYILFMKEYDHENKNYDCVLFYIKNED